MGQGKKRHIVNTMLKFVVSMNFPCKTFGGMKIILYLCTSFFERRISLTSIINVKVKIMTNDFSEDNRLDYHKLVGKHVDRYAKVEVVDGQL